MSHGRLLPVLVLAIVTLFLQTPVCYGENETEVEFSPYTLLDESGAVLTMHGGQIWPGDEYISGDDKWYRVVSVDDAARTATAEYLGDAGDDALTAFAVNQADSRDGKKLIAMYSTHSDESYVPDDGTASKWQNAGIYDVGDSLKAALEKRGIDTVYSKETFLPHDADAYTRSRRTAEELLKQGPDALLDIHRDTFVLSLEPYKIFFFARGVDPVVSGSFLRRTECPADLAGGLPECLLSRKRLRIDHEEEMPESVHPRRTVRCNARERFHKVSACQSCGQDLNDCGIPVAFVSAHLVPRSSPERGERGGSVHKHFQDLFAVREC